MTAPYFPTSSFARARQRVQAARGRVPMSRGDLVTRQEDTMTEERARGAAAGSDYEAWAGNFDASKALNQYATGAFNNVASGLRHILGEQRGAAVGAGRLDTGFFDEDQGEVINRTMADFTNNLSSQAMNAAQLQASVKQGYGAYGERARGEATDLLMSRREEVENAAREDAERKRRNRRGIVGAIGGTLGAAAGGFLGGPAGAMAGWRAGSAFGGG
jgi:hypothetical protein